MIILNTVSLFRSNSAISFHNHTTIITAVGIFTASEAFAKGDLAWGNTPVTATECALYFCVKAPSFAVTEGILSETTIASWAERDMNSYNGLDPICNTTIWDIYDDHSSDYGSEVAYGAVGLKEVQNDANRSDLVLTIPSNDIDHFELLQNTSTIYNISQRAVLKCRPAPITNALYQGHILTSVFEQLAVSLTNCFRDISNVTEVGTVQELAIHIKVEWAFITLPALGFILGVEFCLMTMLETRGLGFDAWKTDIITTLTHSVDAETRARLRSARLHGDVGKTAKSMRVRFEDASSGFELRAQQDETS
ncbi:hypothetical protein F5Y16DRAFT_423152 [Xylariaceae sp. FL0255]|nr:hypothetical protein F5Y16DRAFT_423152 [Xylariaceae sp. FL0255]